MKVNSQLERAQLENLSSLPAAGTTGRIAENTSDGKTYLDNGSVWRPFIKNDDKAILGNSGTAANNIRLHRGANGVLQFVSGADVTAEGTLSTALNQTSSRKENYLAAGLPAFGNAGRVVYVTDTGFLGYDTGAAWKSVVDATTAQTLTNKTLTAPVMSAPEISDYMLLDQTTTPATPASGKNKFYVKADNKLYTLDSAGNEAAVGSGSGGVKNLIVNGSADDTAASIFVPYADVASSRPVDGTGGSPTVTTSITSTNPLDGTKSFLLTKPASNVQGEGWAVPFTVDLAYRAKSVKISVDYIVNSGTFVAGALGVESDVIWYIYDVTNSKLIEPSNIKMFSNSTTNSDKFEATFQTSADGINYRLIAHVASTSALAYALKVDNVTVSPQTYVYGTPITDWASYTPTLDSGWGTPSNIQAFYRRNGSSLQVSLKFTYVTGGSGSKIYLPPGYVISSSLSIPTVVGYLQDNAASDNTRTIIASAGNNYVELGITYTATSLQTAMDPSNIGSNVEIQAQFEVEIAGLSSSVQMSDNADTRITSMSAYKNGGSVTAGTTIASWTGVTKDTHSALNASTGEYTIKSAGDFLVKARTSATGSAGNRIQVYLNGSLWESGTSADAFYFTSLCETLIPNCKAGDIITVVQDSNVTLTSSNIENIFSVTKIMGPSAIAANEVVAAIIVGNPQTSYTADTPIIFPTKSQDTHNAYNTSTGQFTAPTEGFYSITAYTNTNVATGTELSCYVDGVKQFPEMGITESALGVFFGATLVYAKAGQTIDVRVSASWSALGAGHGLTIIKK